MADAAVVADGARGPGLAVDAAADDSLATAAAAALATEEREVSSSASGSRSLLGGDDGDDATVTSVKYGDKVREAIHGTEDFGSPDEAKVRGGAPFPSDSKNEHLAREWLEGKGETADNESMDGTPSWKLPHTGWLSRGKLHTYSPRWFEVYIRFDTAERTAVLARTNSEYVPVLADLPFKMDPTKGVNLAVFAADPAEEYGIFAIDAHIIEETP